VRMASGEKQTQYSGEGNHGRCGRSSTGKGSIPHHQQASVKTSSRRTGIWPFRWLSPKRNSLAMRGFKPLIKPGEDALGKLGLPYSNLAPHLPLYAAGYRTVFHMKLQMGINHLVDPEAAEVFCRYGEDSAGRTPSKGGDFRPSFGDCACSGQSAMIA